MLKHKMIVLLIVCAPAAYANSEYQPSNTPFQSANSTAAGRDRGEWIPIKSVSIRDSSSPKTAVSECLTKMNVTIHGLEEAMPSIKTVMSEKVPDLQFACSEIILDASGFIKHAFNVPLFHYEWSHYNWEIKLYCKPRSLYEQQIYSMAQRCKQQPEENCYKAEFLEATKQFAKTKYIQTFDPKKLCEG